MCLPVFKHENEPEMLVSAFGIVAGPGSCAYYFPVGPDASITQCLVASEPSFTG